MLHGRDLIFFFGFKRRDPRLTKARDTEIYIKDLFLFGENTQHNVQYTHDEAFATDGYK